VLPQKQIFRKVALERLSSPEQLDLVMQVTSARSWIALAAIALLLVTLVLWGIFGSIPEKTQATGILLKQAGIFDVDATSPSPSWRSRSRTPASSSRS